MKSDNGFPSALGLLSAQPRAQDSLTEYKYKKTNPNLDAIHKFSRLLIYPTK